MNLKKTWKNKVSALALLVAGIVSTIPSGDATACTILCFVALPLFFAKENYVD